jgi:hypothetical protein
MICHRMGLPPISIIGFGLSDDSSDIRVPLPPANITTFISSMICFYIASKIMVKKLKKALLLKQGRQF